MFSMFRKDESRRSAEDLVDSPIPAQQNEPAGEDDSSGSPVASRDSVVVDEVRDTTEPLASDDVLVVDDGPYDVARSPEDQNADQPAGAADDVAGSDPSTDASPESAEDEPREDAATGATLWRSGRLVPRGRTAPRRINGPLVAPPQNHRGSYSPQERILLLDTWQRSGLPAKDFADLIGISKHTLYKWKQLFQKHGPEGLLEQPRRGKKSSRLPEVTKRAILMLKKAHPDWGCERIGDALARGPALSASPSAIARVLKEDGYERVEQATRAHNRPKVKTFERARPNQLWQTDLFTFMLKRQNRRLYLVAFMDDHSRFIVSYGLHASASTALVLEVLEAAIADYGAPEEILTDNGPQYVSWRGKSRFTRHLEKRGIRQIVAKPKRPQTLGKVERFWGTLWRELIEGSVFTDLADARTRIGHYLDYYNFLRTHSGIGGLVPADRFFSAADQTRLALKDRVAANALELARGGPTKTPFYLSGNVSGQPFSVHAEGERLVLNREGEYRKEIELAAPAADAEDGELPMPVCPHAAPASHQGELAEAPPLPPGQSVVDELASEGDREGGDAV